jgi:hypothetical protein
LGFLSFGHIVNVIYHVLGALKGVNLNLFGLSLILVQIVHCKVFELLILTSFKLVCICVGPSILKIGKLRRSRLFIEDGDLV